MRPMIRLVSSRAARWAAFSMAAVLTAWLASRAEDAPAPSSSAGDDEPTAFVGQPGFTTAEQTPIWSLSYSPDGKRIAAGTQRVGDRPSELCVWEVATGREVYRIVAPQAFRIVAYSPDGSLIATAGFDRIARLHDAATGQERRALSGHAAGVNALAFSPDGTTLATASWDKTVKLWDVATGRERRTLEGHTAQVYAVAFRPDGKSLASCGRDETARVWDVASGRETATLRGHGGVVESLAFSPDGKPRSRPPAGTRPSASGTRRSAASWPRSKGTPTRSSASPSLPTARRSPRRAPAGATATPIPRRAS